MAPQPGGPSMEDEVMAAARSGNIDQLYQIIRKDVNVLSLIEKMEFVDTPLHVAAAKGQTEFAMEMMYLKPSFATKLDKDGLSPLHRALQEGHTRLALSLLKIDKSLVGVKGKMGYTPFHYLAMKETNYDLLIEFLNVYPNCINDVTSHDETALHIAARSNNMEALEVLLQWLRRTSNCSFLRKQRILNSKNSNGETVLHLAVSNDQPKPTIVRLLTDLRIKTEAENSEKLTALGILINRRILGHNSRYVKNCIDILRRNKVLMAASITPWFLLELCSQWCYEIKHMSADRGNALLVVTVLILTATYQATLGPPGGVLQANAPNNGNNKVSSLQIYVGSTNTSSSAAAHVVENIEFKGNDTVGSSVLQTKPFLWFFVPNMVAFSSSFLLTCLVLLTIVSGFFSLVLMLSLSTLLFCLMDSALIIISPNDQSSRILLCFVYTLVYITYLAIAPVIIHKIRKFFK